MNKYNVVSGKCLKEVFIKENKRDNIIAFNEAMNEGNPLAIIFSDDFIKLRADFHHVTLDEYKKEVIEEIKPLLNANETYELWFDTDSFCQINLITILGYLDSKKYKYDIRINYLTSDHKFIKQIVTRTKNFYEVYYDVLIRRKVPSIKLWPEMDKGIREYLQK